MSIEKINSLFITKINDDKPIMVVNKGNETISLNIHIQFIDVKTSKISLNINIKDQTGKQVGQFKKDIQTPDEKLSDKLSYMGEITTFLILLPDEFKDINSLTFDVIINNKAKGTTVLFLKEVNDEQ